MVVNHRVTFKKDSQNNENYEKDKEGNEYYPVTGEFAVDNKKKYQYARTANNSVIFPKDEYGNEFYFQDNNGEFIDLSMKFRYAERCVDEEGNKEQYYPRKIIKSPEKVVEIVEYTIDMNYAFGSDGLPYYPLGFSGNEYFIYSWKPPDDYPISHDGYYLVPFDEMRGEILYFSGKKYDVTEDNLVEIIKVYENIEHYRTNLPSGRKPRKITPFINMELYSPDSTNYSLNVATRPSVQVSDTKTFYSMYIYILIIIIVIITFIGAILGYKKDKFV